MRIAEQQLIGRSSVQITFMGENLCKSEFDHADMADIDKQSLQERLELGG